MFKSAASRNSGSNSGCGRFLKDLNAKQFKNLDTMEKEYKEYSIITPFDEQHFENKKDAQLFWNSLPLGTQITSQFFSKIWIKDGQDFKEGEVIILSK